MDLIQSAQEVRNNAYAPYSGYPVGAALEDAQGRIFTGVNVENISFGATICAERCAIAKMVSVGSRKIVRIAIATIDGGIPCGICLQTILEFASDPTTLEVITVDDSHHQRAFQLSELIPFGFHSSEVHRTE